MRAEGCGGHLLAYWVKSEAYSVMDIGETTPMSPQTTGTALVNGVKIKVIFDTGAGTSFLSLAAAKRAGIDANGPGVIDAGLSGGIGRRTVRTWIAPVDSFTIGGEQIRHTKLRVGAAELFDADMLIGPDFFLSHRVYVAKSQHKLYFTYNGGPVFDLSTTPRDQDQSAANPAEPTNAEAFSRRGAAFAARKEFDRAIADLTRACELAPGEASYFYQRGMARMGARQPALAMGDFDQALKLKPDDVDTLVARAELRLAGGEAKAAVADLDGASRADGKEADGRFILAALYLRAGAFPAATREYDQWIVAHPDDSRRPVALAGRCWARAVSGVDLAAALADCDAALKLTPRSAPALDSRGLVRLRLGDLDKSIADYSAALTLRPNVAWSLYGRGIAKLRKGLSAEGKADIAAAATLAPKLPEEARARGIAP